MSGVDVHPSGAPPLAPRPTAALARVLVALDLAPGSEQVLGRAAQLPWRPEGGELHVVHVLPEEASSADGEQALRSLSATLAESPLSGPGGRVRLHPLVRRGRPLLMVGQLARETQAELVLVGQPHPGASWFSRHSGRLGGGLLRAVQVPLLVVSRSPLQPYQHPLVAVDFTPASLHALARCLALCPQAREVTVVHIYEAPAESVLYRTGASIERVMRFEEELGEEMRASLEAFIAPVRREGVTFTLQVLRGEPERDWGLCQLATQCDADLVAFGRHPRPGLGRLLRPHLCESVLPQGCIDVWVDGVAG